MAPSIAVGHHREAGQPDCIRAVAAEFILSFLFVFAGVGSSMAVVASSTSQTNDYCAIPRFLKDQVSERYPGARRAIMKSGGDFPFLSRPDEVNLYLQLHLRRVGVEAKHDQISGISKDGGSGGLHDDDDDDKGDGRGDDPQDGQGSSGSGHGPQSPGRAGGHDVDNGSRDEDDGSPESSHELPCSTNVEAFALGLTPLIGHALSVLLMAQLTTWEYTHTGKTIKA